MQRDWIRPSDAPQDSLLLTTEQAAAMLAVSPRTIFTLGKDGDLPRVQIGRSVRFRRSDLLAFIERGTGEARQTDGGVS